MGSHTNVMFASWIFKGSVQVEQFGTECVEGIAYCSRTEARLLGTWPTTSWDAL